MTSKVQTKEQAEYQFKHWKIHHWNEENLEDTKRI
jgi:hypothetical protein